MANLPELFDDRIESKNNIELEQDNAAVREAVVAGLSLPRRSLPAWLFYDARGSELFEEITELSEYYLARTEKKILADSAEEIVEVAANGRRLTVIELGAGSAKKSKVILNAVTLQQGSVLYQPVDVSSHALDEAQELLEQETKDIEVRPVVGNYVTNPIQIDRELSESVLAMYIGSSIGNFSPEESRRILTALRETLVAGDYLLLGTDLAPGAGKSVRELIAAYDDNAGITAAFNLNLLTRLNREIGANFDLSNFFHTALWNEQYSRIEMHLKARRGSTVRIPLPSVDAEDFAIFRFMVGETIHTENSYKYTITMLESLLSDCGFSIERRYNDEGMRYMVTLSRAV